MSRLASPPAAPGRPIDQGNMACAAGVVTSWVMESAKVSRCVTCGSELRPERAAKYDYCMAPECQEKNARGLTMVAVGINKAAEQYLILDEDTREELASGKYHDQRRGSFGPPAPRSPAGTPARPAGPAPPPPPPLPPSPPPGPHPPRALRRPTT